MNDQERALREEIAGLQQLVVHQLEKLVTQDKLIAEQSQLIGLQHAMIRGEVLDAEWFDFRFIGRT